MKCCCSISESSVDFHESLAIRQQLVYKRGRDESPRVGESAWLLSGQSDRADTGAAGRRLDTEKIATAAAAKATMMRTVWSALLFREARCAEATVN